MRRSIPELRVLPDGVPTIIATVFGMALADAFVKYASTGMSLWQIWVLRSLFVIPILLVLANNRSGSGGRGWIALRSVVLALMYLGIYAAIPLLDLSVIAAGLYTAPLFIVGLSGLVLRAPMTLRHWIAILTGFAGVVVILRPTAAGFTPLALLPVGSALLYAIGAVITRAKCSQLSATVLALWLNLSFLALGGAASALLVACAQCRQVASYPFLFGVWQDMNPADWRVIAVLAVLMLGIAIGLAKAYQSPHPQVIATFDYAYLIFATFWGYVFFGEVPDLLTLVGMALIAAAGVIVLSSRRRDPAAGVDHASTRGCDSQTVQAHTSRDSKWRGWDGY
jgi:drug/metabolite transporter (DMT)-like permease